jgi:hypothetical protein
MVKAENTPAAFMRIEGARREQAEKKFRPGFQG